MNTLNKDIQIFNTEKSARKYFALVTTGHLLFGIHTKAWYVDQSKTAKFALPEHYSLIENKKLKITL